MENVCLNKNIHQLMKNNDGIVEQDQEGNWLVRNLETDEIFVVYPNPEVLRFFEIMDVNEDVENEQPYNGDNFSWNRATTWLLIKEYHKHKDEFRNPKRKKRDIWQQIKEVFNKLEYDVSIDNLDRKFRNLKKTFKVQKDKSKKTGRGPSNWEYFDELDAIFFNDLTVNRPETLASIPTTSALSAISPDLPSRSAVSAIPPDLPSRSAVASAVPSSSSSTTVQEQAEANVHSASATPCSRRKTPKNTELYNLRKKQLDVEKERVEELRKLRLAIEENNVIQRERNETLKQIAINSRK